MINIILNKSINILYIILNYYSTLQHPRYKIVNAGVDLKRPTLSGSFLRLSPPDNTSFASPIRASRK